ncbi:MAG: CvpA family protein [Acutalibacteraceae bacterium]
MQYIIDIILVAIFAVIVFFAAKKGFFLTLFELAAYIISTVAAKVFSASFAPTVFENYFSSPIRKSIAEQIGDIADKDISKEIEASFDKIPEQLNGILQFIGIDKESIMSQVSDSDFSGKNVLDNIMDKVVSPIAVAVIQTILFIIIVVVLTFVLRLIIKLLDRFIKKLPAINRVNTGLGAALGAIKGLIVVCLLALIIGSFAGITKSQAFVESVNDSLIINATRGVFTSISGYSA